MIVDTGSSLFAVFAKKPSRHGQHVTHVQVCVGVRILTHVPSVAECDQLTFFIAATPLHSETGLDCTIADQIEGLRGKYLLGRNGVLRAVTFLHSAYCSVGEGETCPGKE